MNIIMQLDELACPSCLTKIEAGVSKLVGIKNVKVLFNASKVNVNFDENKIKPEIIKNKISDLGYDVKEVKIK